MLITFHNYTGGMGYIYLMKPISKYIQPYFDDKNVYLSPELKNCTIPLIEDKGEIASLLSGMQISNKTYSESLRSGDNGVYFEEDYCNDIISDGYISGIEFSDSRVNLLNKILNGAYKIYSLKFNNRDYYLLTLDFKDKVLNKRNRIYAANETGDVLYICNTSTHSVDYEDDGLSGTFEYGTRKIKGVIFEKNSVYDVDYLREALFAISGKNFKAILENNKNENSYKNQKQLLWNKNSSSDAPSCSYNGLVAQSYFYLLNTPQDEKWKDLEKPELDADIEFKRIKLSMIENNTKLERALNTLKISNESYIEYLNDENNSCICLMENNQEGYLNRLRIQINENTVEKYLKYNNYKIVKVNFHGEKYYLLTLNSDRRICNCTDMIYPADKDHNTFYLCRTHIELELLEEIELLSDLDDYDESCDLTTEADLNHSFTNRTPSKTRCEVQGILFKENSIYDINYLKEPLFVTQYTCKNSSELDRIIHLDLRNFEHHNILRKDNGQVEVYSTVFLDTKSMIFGNHMYLCKVKTIIDKETDIKNSKLLKLFSHKFGRGVKYIKIDESEKVYKTIENFIENEY